MPLEETSVLVLPFSSNTSPHLIEDPQDVGYVKPQVLPYRIRRKFCRLNGWNISFVKVLDFVPLEPLSGPGAPDPVSARYVRVWNNVCYIPLCLNRKFQSTGFGRNFWMLNGWNISFAKVLEFVPLEPLSGSGAPDSVSARYVRVWNNVCYIHLCLNRKFQSIEKIMDSLYTRTQTCFQTLPLCLNRKFQTIEKIMSSLYTRTQTCFQTLLDHQSFDTCTRTDTSLQIQHTLESESCDTCTRTETLLQIKHTLESDSCDTCTRTEPILQIQHTLESESCDTCTRTETLLQIKHTLESESCDTCTRTETILRIQHTLESESCDTCARTKPILKIQHTLECESCDTCTRTEPILKLESILKSQKSLQFLLFLTLAFPWPWKKHCNY